MTGAPTIEARRAGVAAATSLLSGLAGSVVSVGNADLGPFLRQVDDLSRQVDAARVAIVAEALGRGVVASSECATERKSLASLLRRWTRRHLSQRDKFHRSCEFTLAPVGRL